MTQTLPDIDMQAAVLTWYDQDFCTIRVRADGTKAPEGKWTEYQINRPSRDQVERWYSRNHPGVGLVCGRVSGGLEMFELEGRAVAEGAREKLVPALRGSGVYDVWMRLVKGYVEQTPSGGLHFLFRVADHPVPGNTKIATRPARDDELTDDERELLARHPNKKVIVRTLAETRGEGGFVVVAPSHGPTHGTGEPWTLCNGSQYGVVPAITWEERNALYSVVRAVLDETPDPEPEPVRPGAETRPAAAGTGDRPGDHWARETSWAHILEPHGWVLAYRHGDMDYWRRPGKRIGISARTGGTFDGLYVWSTSTEFPSEQSITKFRAYSILEHRRDDRAASAELRRKGFGADRPLVADRQAGLAATTKHDTSTDDAKFWTTRPVLAHLHTFARARRVSPWAVLGVTLVRIAVATPPWVVLPPLVGNDASLNLFVGLIGPSGAGKGAAEAVAEVALDMGVDMPFPIGVGSGEGLSHLFMRRVRDKDTKQWCTEQHTVAVMLSVAEVDTLAALVERRSSTIMPELRKAWVGETLGFAYADPEKRLPVPAHRYRLGLIVGIQPARAGGLLAEADGGTPQRFLWLPATDAGAPDIAPAAPVPWDWKLPTLPTAEYQSGHVVLPVCRSARELVDAARLARLRGDADALDGHALLARLKVAALLGLLEGHPEVTEDDWELAGRVMGMSDRTRAAVVDTLAQATVQQNRRRGEAEADRAIVVDERREEAAIKRSARTVARRLSRAGGAWMTHSELRRALASGDRQYFETSIERLLDSGQVETEPTDRAADGHGGSGCRYRLVGGGK